MFVIAVQYGYAINSNPPTCSHPEHNTFTTTFVGDCARNCRQDARCLIFGFGINTSGCKLYNSCVTTTGNSGFDYYKKQGNSLMYYVKM